MQLIIGDYTLDTDTANISHNRTQCEGNPWLSSFLRGSAQCCVSKIGALELTDWGEKFRISGRRKWHTVRLKYRDCSTHICIDRFGDIISGLIPEIRLYMAYKIGDYYILTYSLARKSKHTFSLILNTKNRIIGYWFSQTGPIIAVENKNWFIKRIGDDFVARVNMTGFPI